LCASSSCSTRHGKTQTDALEAQLYAMQLITFITQHGGNYLRDEQDGYSVLLQGKRIEINLDRKNFDLNLLLLKVCKITMLDHIAGPTIVRELLTD
jgi:hypothetical protein